MDHQERETISVLAEKSDYQAAWNHREVPLQPGWKGLDAGTDQVQRQRQHLGQSNRDIRIVGSERVVAQVSAVAGLTPGLI